MTTKNTQSVEEIFGDMIITTDWAKANEAFYKWEINCTKGKWNLSDDDRMIWVEGYLQALKDAS